MNAQAFSRVSRAIARRLIAATALLVATLAPGQYAIDWYKVAGGGGTSTGGVYSVSGTIGQSDASVTPMTNGQYSLVGGFWALPVAVQTTNAPWLTITLAGPGSATISWAPNTPGYVLQYTASFTPTNWINAPSGSPRPSASSASPVRRYTVQPATGRAPMPV